MFGSKGLLLLTFLILGKLCAAQTTRDVGDQPPPPIYQAMRDDRNFFQRLFNRPAEARPYESEDQFEDRMRNVARQRRREARMENRPEYSNTFYFGHRRPPRKRPPGKKKYCRICEFAH